MHHRNRRRGFTLVEAMVWTAIVSISLCFALPSFVDMSLSERADALETDLFSVLSFARFTAVDNQEIVTVCSLDTTGACAAWGQTISVFADTNANETLDSGETLLKTAQFNFDHWLLSNRPASRSFFQWNALGIANGTAGSLQLCRPGWKEGGRALVIAFSGRIRTSMDFDGDGVEERTRGTPIHC